MSASPPSPLARSGRRVSPAAIRTTFVGCLLLAISLGVPVRAEDAPVAAEAERPARIGFSRNMFRGVNENDARASLRSYTAALSRDLHIPVATDPVMFEGLVALRALLRDNAMDTISLTTDEFFEVEGELLPTPLLISTVDGQSTEEYVLAVHRDSGLARVADLRGRRLLLLDTMRASLAPEWLEVLLATEGLGPPAAFFGEVSLVAKPAKVALPVFFRQEDACVLTRRALDLLGELNPQVAAQLRILATSAKIVPAVTCFRRNIAPAQADRVTAAVLRSHLWPSGKQVMTIFQCDRVEAQPSSLLENARELWTAYRQLHAATGTVSSPIPAPTGEGGPR